MPKHNHVTLMGHLTRDAEYNEYGNSAKTQFSIGVGRDFGDESDFIQITVWNRGNYKQAVYHRDLQKGDAVFIEGRIKQERWETEEGNRSKLVVDADKVVRIPKREEQSGGQEFDDNFDADDFDIDF